MGFNLMDPIHIHTVIFLEKNH